MNGSTLDEIRLNIEERDKQDRGRAIDPLKPAEDAVIVDTSDLDLDGVLHVLLDTVAEKSRKRSQPAHAVAWMTVDPSETTLSKEEMEKLFREACQKGKMAGAEAS